MYDDLEAFVSPEMIRDSFWAAAAGAGGILVATWLNPMLKGTLPDSWDEETKHRVLAGTALVGGALVGRALWDYNRDWAMAVVGGVGGLALAQLIDTFFDRSLLGGNPLGAMPEDIELSASDEALLEAYDPDQQLAMNSMEGLGTTGVTMAPGAFADPTVTPEALMGFNGTVVQAESLGYNPYMA
jgi:hypothetical protein